VDSATGVISGTPTTAGTYSVAIGATNAGGTGTTTLTITISAGASTPEITSATTATGTVGTAFSYTITASGSPTSYSASGLPSTLSINTTTGVISGTPTATGTYSVTIGATNSAGTGTATLTLTIVIPIPVITSDSTATGAMGMAFSYTITATNSPTSYGATNLPTGLSVSTTTGVISGTPTVEGATAVTISATNSVGTGSATLTITIKPTTATTTLAGDGGTAGSSDGTGTAAHFNHPSDVAMDSSSNVYVTDTDNHTIRKITSGGVVTTLAGLAGVSGSTDGTGSAARFNYPSGVTIDSSGNLYVADTDNHTIRKITSAGVVTTVAGGAGISGTADGTGTAARFNYPCDLAADSSGNLYVVDTGSNTVRMISSSGTVTTVAGAAGKTGSTDGTGTSARFSSPTSIAVGSSSTSTSAAQITTMAEALDASTGTVLYVADTDNNTIRKISASGAVTTVAGTAGVSGTSDGSGTAALFNAPSGIAADSSGYIYVADTDNNTIRRINSAGTVTTLAGTSGTSGDSDGTGTASTFSSPAGITVDSDGDLYVADSNNNTVRIVAALSAPEIVTNPSSLTAAVGSTATFSVVAAGVPTPTYQWYKGTSTISGATAATYTLSSVATSDAGSYTVTVINTMGTVTSSAAVLTVSSTSSTASATTSSKGGGAVEPWFVVVLALLGALTWVGRRRPPFSRAVVLSRETDDRRTSKRDEI